MSKLLSIASLVAILMILMFPKPAISLSTNDLVCKFKYKMGDTVWVTDSEQGTTLIKAKHNRTKRIDFLKLAAKEKNQELKVIYLNCDDPWGNN